MKYSIESVDFKFILADENRPPPDLFVKRLKILDLLLKKLFGDENAGIRPPIWCLSEVCYINHFGLMG